jgi:hypothetical protein
LEANLLQIVGFTAAGLLVVGWLVVSFTAPSPRRTVIEWLSAIAMYVALLSLFAHLMRRALAADNVLAIGAVGFLCVLFGGGLLVAIYRTIVAARGGESTATPSATS